jgi:glycosyltransferase involved in cell wall biosynthesis
MRILFCASVNSNAGGICVWAGHIYRYSKERIEDRCTLEPFYSPKEHGIDQLKSRWYRLYIGLSNYAIMWLRLIGRLICNKYDAVHLCSSASLGVYRDWLYIHTIHMMGGKAVLHFHFGRIPELAKLQNKEWKMIDRLIRMADCSIVIDESSYNALKAHGLEKISYIPNPIAPDVLKLIPEVQPERSPRTILFVGQGLATKGVIELVEACKRIPNIKLRMLGLMLDDMKEQLLQISNHEDWLEILGRQDMQRVVDEMSRCDLFVLPTYTEGFPNVILEAMACRCAIITTPVGAIPQMLEEENGKHYGVFVEPRNTEQLYQAMVDLLDNVSLKNELRNNVRERVIQRYNISSVWNQMMNVWQTTKTK